MTAEQLEQIVLDRPDICDRWRQHRGSSTKAPLSLAAFAERAIEHERKERAQAELSEGAAYYANIP